MQIAIYVLIFETKSQIVLNISNRNFALDSLGLNVKAPVIPVSETWNIPVLKSY